MTKTQNKKSGKSHKPFKPMELFELMKSLQSDDNEAAHSRMDDLLCEQLCRLGFTAAVEVFNAQPKFYA